MCRRLLSWLAALLLLVASAGPAPAQGQPAGPADEAEKDSGPVPALQVTVAVLSALLVLFIVCKPSRKG